jgi:hypothetical protein
MKRGGLVLFTLLFFLYLFTGVLFAQTTPKLATAGRAVAQAANPSPTPKTAQPTGNPTPNLTQSPLPTSQVTAAPTPQTDNPTNVPANTQNSQTAGPTATPAPVPPTPTTKPKPLVLPVINNKPPVKPLNQIITAPFDLVMSSLPQSYYNDEGMTALTNKVLLSFAFLSLLSGTVLLLWPTIVKAKRRLFAPRIRERKSLPYLAGRA